MKKGQAHPSTNLYNKFIINAFWELIMEKPLAAITITELCQRADISRRTFYRHFEKKEDIVQHYMMQVMKDLSDCLAPTLQAGNIPQFAESFFTLITPYINYIAVFNKNGLGDIVFACYIKCFTTMSQEVTHTPVQAASFPNTTDCKMAYLLGGLWSLFIFWLSHGCRQNPAELSRIISS